jgi:predicted TIM-barrel fold metal-dependent hydrolase
MALEVIKKIDIHEHCVPWQEYTPEHPKHHFKWLSAEELLDIYCEKLNIEKCVLLPISSPEAQMVSMSNEMTKYIVDKYPDRFIFFCNVDPRALKNSADSDLGYLLEFYMSLGAKGVGEITANIYADDPRLDNLFSYCEELDLPVTIHIAPEERGYYGIIDELGLPRIEKMLKKHPKLKIFGHSQCFWSEIGENSDEIRCNYVKGPVRNGRLPALLREYENLYCDLSAGSGANALMRDREHAARFIEEFSDRLMYGSDICSTIQTFPFKFDEFLTSMRENGEISEENYKKLVRDNACRLIKL